MKIMKVLRWVCFVIAMLIMTYMCYCCYLRESISWSNIFITLFWETVSGFVFYYLIIKDKNIFF
jgi:hypothetical protein